MSSSAEIVQHPAYGLRTLLKDKNFDRSSVRNSCIAYSKNIANLYCLQLTSRRQTKCDCLIRMFSETAIDSDELFEEVHGHIGDTLMAWGESSMTERYRFAHQWFRQAAFLQTRMKADRQKCYFTMPDLTFTGGGQERNYTESGWDIYNGGTFCRNALMNLFGIGANFVATVKSGLVGIEHGLAGKSGMASNRNKGRALMYTSMREHLLELQTEAAPFATRVIRDETGTTVRGDDVDEVVLPPHYSIHKIYVAWVCSMGWQVTYSNRARTRHNAIDKYIRVEEGFDDDNGIAKQQVCSYRCFRMFWKKEFPKLKMRNRGEDVCTDCVIFTNRLNALRKRRRHNQAVACANSNPPQVHTMCLPATPQPPPSQMPTPPLTHQPVSSQGEGAVEETEGILPASLMAKFQELRISVQDPLVEVEVEINIIPPEVRGVRVGSDIAPEDLEGGNGNVEVDGEIGVELDGDSDTEEVDETEFVNLLMLAKTHVIMAKCQRTHLQSQCAFVKQNNSLLTQFSKCISLTIDMGQNIGLPNLAGEQAGDTYYMTAKNLFNFGVVDNETGKMNCYVWKEEDSKRGANNIVSCLHFEFKKRGVFEKKFKDGELFICGDNCAGQNKNETMLRYLVWLCESGYFSRVQLSFLIKGHTKNACDRMFNLLKFIYRNVNIYAYSQLIEVLDTHQDITVVPVTNTNMFDFQEWLDGIYVGVRSGTVFSEHVFTIKKATPTLLLRQKYIEAPIKGDCQDLLPKRGKKKKTPEARLNAITFERMEAELKSLPAPGMDPLKAHDLFKKWRPLLPEKYQEETCPFPGDAIMASVKEKKNTKRRDKKKAQDNINEDHKAKRGKDT